MNPATRKRELGSAWCGHRRVAFQKERSAPNDRFDV